MSKIIVICDSSCDYSAEQAAAANFTMVPLSVSFGDESFLDGVELTPAQFYEKQAAYEGMPKTSQPSPEQFIRAFRAYPDADDIICVCMTGESSGTVQSALTAAALLSQEGFSPNIHVIDSRNASCAVGLMAEEATRMAQANEPIAQILARLEGMRRTLALYFFLDTLEFVRRGGRIGNISAVVGQLLGIKPILTFLHGAPTDVDKCRGFQQATQRLVRKFLDTASNLREVTIVHANAPARAKELANLLRDAAAGICVHIHSAGAIIGTYAGPGALGIAFEERDARF